MKATLAIVLAAVFASGPAFAQDADAVLEKSLVTATRKAIDVAPWIKITVAEVSAGEKLQWIARTGAGQRYACTGPASADALMAASQIACVKAKSEPTNRERLSADAQLYSQGQRARMPLPGQYNESGN